MEQAPDLSAIRLSGGIHPNREDGMCLLEAVAWWAGEPHTHHPQCVCPVLARLCEELNEATLDDDRSQLVVLIPLLARSKSKAEVEWQRAFLLADYALRDHHALTLEYWGYEDQALELLELAPITGHTTAMAVAEVLAKLSPTFPEKHRYWFGDHPASSAQAVLKSTTAEDVAGVVSEMIATDCYSWAHAIELIERACRIGNDM